MLAFFFLYGDHMVSIHTGSCLCGTVKFKTHGKLRDVVGCHCGQCRKQTGNFWTATSSQDDDLTVEGGENLSWYYATPGIRRGFCKICGSFLFWKRDEADYTAIGGGAFDRPTGLIMDRHIYCVDKGDYYELGDGLPQYEKGSPGIVTAE